MNKKLAIKGHSTRGKEVIKLLEMLGGTNPFPINDGMATGNEETNCYYVSENTATKYISWNYIGPKEIDNYIIFTLEEFLEKYPFKVGDKVQVLKSGTVFTIGNMIWNDEVCDIYYCNMDDIEYYNVEELKLYKETDNTKPVTDKSERTYEDVIFDSIIWHLRNSVNNGKQNLSGGECEEYFREVVKKNNENKMKSVLAELFEHIKNTSKEELEKEFKEIEEWSNVGPTVEEFMDFCDKVNKKLKYPNTYDECYQVHTTHDTALSLVNKTEVLHDLLICRNAYWKIAGEEMGLGKPWEPKYQTLIHNEYFTIHSFNSELIKGATSHRNAILAFPTEEMRDVFYENFKDLIEQCKELL